MNEKQVLDLALKLSNSGQHGTIAFSNLITEWLEQNQSEPVVVGLSDEQVYSLGDKLILLLNDGYRPTVGEFNHAIFEFLRHKTFTQPEVKEVVVGLTEKQISLLTEVVVGVDNVARVENRITGWLMTQKFEKPQVKEVPVGLTDAQLESLHNARYKQYLSLTDFINNYRQWAKSQNFEKSEVTKLEKEIAEMQISYISLQRYCSELKKELEKLKSQQFKPDWKNIPKQAVEALMMVRFFDSAGMCCLNEDIILNRAERPKPTVEVGQVWKYTQNGDKYQIDSIGDMKNDCDAIHWIKCVTYRSLHDGGFYTRTLSDFLTKFERVG